MDTGATVNLIEELDYLRLKEVVLKKTSTKIFLYDSQVSLKILGKFETVIETHESVTCAEFYVVRKNTKAGGSLICYKTAHVVLAQVSGIMYSNQTSSIGLPLMP